MESSDKEEDISNGPDLVSLKSMMKGPGGVFCAGLYNDNRLCQSWSLTCMVYNRNLNSWCITLSADTIGDAAVSSVVRRLWCSEEANVVEVQVWSGRKVWENHHFTDMFKDLVAQSCLFLFISWNAAVIPLVSFPLWVIVLEGQLKWD